MDESSMSKVLTSGFGFLVNKFSLDDLDDFGTFDSLWGTPVGFKVFLEAYLEDGFSKNKRSQ